MEEIKIKTSTSFEIIDITDKIQEKIKEKDFKEGIVFIFIPHTTCALTLNENETNLKKDFFKFFQRLTNGIEFSHNLIDDNASSHLFSSLLSQEKFLLVENGKLILGTWQRLLLVELDGPRERKIYLKFLKK